MVLRLRPWSAVRFERFTRREMGGLEGDRNRGAGRQAGERGGIEGV